LQNVFRVHDVEGKGTIRGTDIGILLQGLGLELDEDALSNILVQIRRFVHDAVHKSESKVAVRKTVEDVDWSVSFAVFVEWFEEWDARQAFTAFDIDKSGYIDVSEVRHLTLTLGVPLNEEEAAEAVATLDRDGSGQLCFNEFAPWWSQLKQIKRLMIFSQNEEQQQQRSTRLPCRSDAQEIVSFDGSKKLGNLASLIHNAGNSKLPQNKAFERAQVNATYFALQHQRNLATANMAGRVRAATLRIAGKHGIDAADLLREVNVALSGA